MDAADNILSAYLDTIKSLENYLEGFTLLQTIAFLYGLEKFLKSLYNYKLWVILAIIIATVANWLVLIVANKYEIRVSDQLIQPTSKHYAEALSLIKEAFWCRGGLITMINSLAAGIFYVAATKFKPAE